MNLTHLFHRSLSEDLYVLLGKMTAEIMKNRNDGNGIQSYEFKVFSQFGDDGIIQYLISKMPSIPKKFIEFGVENYTESNTRFLLMNNNWSGLVMDGDKENIKFIRNDHIYWKYALQARCEFITKENINSIIKSEKFDGEIGILSIDIDGNDYWIWKAIQGVNPWIVIVEYNSVFGSKKSITIPYLKNFMRTNAHSSNLYWGTSLGALIDLGISKGYAFIGCNNAGNNAYFIRKDLMKKRFRALSLQEGYVESKFRESRDTRGKLTFIRGSERLLQIKNLPVYNTKTDKIEKL